MAIRSSRTIQIIAVDNNSHALFNTIEVDL